MKNEMDKIIQEVMNPMLMDAERKTLAIRVAYSLLCVANFCLEIEENGELLVFSNEGEIVLDSKGYIRFEEK